MVVPMLRKAGGLALATSLLIAGPAVAQQSQHARVYGVGAPASADELPAGAFRDSLLALSPQARGRALQVLQGLTTPAADFAHMRVESRGGIYYVDPAPAAGVDDQAATTLLEGTLSATDVFTLHSKPGAAKTLYIDFDGHVLKSTVWNSSSHSEQAELDMEPFDLDGDPSTFSQAELNRIAESWRRVAEDFADFDIDVTTEEPPYTTGAGGRIEYGPNVGHDLVTGQVDANGHWAVYATGSCGCGGIAYVNIFGNSYYQPALSFNASLSSNAMTIAHETGHNLGLSHDGTSTSGYYSGHGSGEMSWGPIMGAPFGKSLVTWSRNEYPDANNSEDDYAVINRFLPFRTDDHEDVLLGAATALQLTGGVNVASTTRAADPGWSDLANKGIIEDPNDYDLFSMSVGTGTIDLAIDPVTRESFEGGVGADLDIQARLLDSAGNVLQTSNPDGSASAQITYSVALPGDYYLEITGVGRDGTGSGGDYGHADYSATGQYYINGTVPAETVITYPPVAPDDLLATLAGGSSIELSWTDPVASADANETDYYVYRSVDGSGYGLLATLPQDSVFYADNNLANGDYSYYVKVSNSAGSDSTDPTAAITVAATAVAVATSESTGQGSIVSGTYASTQVAAGSETLSEQHSGGRKQDRQSYLDHSWTVTGVQAAPLTELTVAASAPANGEGDNFTFSYAVDGGAWQPIDTLFAGDSETFTATLPTPTSGTVQVRVEDTDHTSGNANTDTVSVSLIKITSIGDPGEQPPTVSILDPADGTTVPSGTELAFTASADDYEDGDISASIAWSSDIDGGLGTGASANVILSGGAGPVTHVVTASVTDSADNTATDTITVTVDDTPAATSVSVADLDGSAASRGHRWMATVTVTVADNLGVPMSGATVSGSWSAGASGSASCQTDGSGQCSISKRRLAASSTSAIFTVNGIAGSMPYDSGGNADPDGDSDGTAITVSAP